MKFDVLILTKLGDRVEQFEGEVEAAGWDEVFDAIPEDAMPEPLRGDEPPEGLTAVSIRLEVRDA